MTGVVVARSHIMATLLLLLAAPLGMAKGLAAESDKTDELALFAIPAQELSTALDEYSQVTGLAVMLDPRLAQGRRSVRVYGRFKARDGLEMLLGASGLMAQHSAKDAFTVKPAEVAPSLAQERLGATRSGTRDSFAGALQQALSRALCAHALTRPGHYRAVLQLWIGAQGELQHSRLLASTGDEQRDNAVVESLRRLSVGQSPPRSLPQPVTVLLVPGVASGDTACNRGEGMSQ
jgi:type II secretory pathway component GspD/PulD (secretin)